MKQLYRVLPVMLSVGLFGCGNNNTATTTTTTAPESATPAVTETKEEFVSKLPDSAPIVRVATEANYAPYDFKDEFGNVTGFDVELMQQIGEDQGFKIELYNDPWEDLFENLDTKSRDMIAAGTTYSEERASKYLLSDPYVPLPGTLVYVNEALNINSLNDLSNVKIGVLSNSAQFRYFTKDDTTIESLEEYPTTFAAIQAMAQGKVDAVASDSGVIRYTMNELPELQPKYFDYEGITSETARKVFIVDKNQPELLKKLNTGLQDLKDNGTYANLTTKWFGTDLTKTALEQQQKLSAVE
ncbi:substrate-binding periplasmic protein [uncultured Psychrobacter sp.]|uniref:substrate-binding periplasmic protein n=1 Tax=uncultured Psychrobacter sp. TaxID=259303 RepID=UPI00345B1C4C